MKVTRSDLRVRIMTILYQINIYEKDKNTIYTDCCCRITIGDKL